MIEIKETNRHDKTSARLLSKLMNTKANLFESRKDTRNIRIAKIARDIDTELAPEIFEALEFVRNGGK